MMNELPLAKKQRREKLRSKGRVVRGEEAAMFADEAGKQMENGQVGETYGGCSYGRC